MGSAGGDTPALATNPKFIFFTDFDGTVTTADSNDHMTDNLGFGVERRRWLNKEVLYGRMNFRDSFDEMISSIPTPFDECVEILKRDIKLDPGFKEFYIWAQENNVPIVILSGGMQPVIRALLDTLLGPGWNIQIVSNDVAPREGKSINEKGGWKIQFHDERLVILPPFSSPVPGLFLLTLVIIATTVTTSRWKSANTRPCPTGLPCSTPVMAFRICRQPKRLISCLQRPIRVRTVSQLPLLPLSSHRS
jgi:2,3-diketo-5-methylthio-1-phosphopentane phosphatase